MLARAFHYDCCRFDRTALNTDTSVLFNDIGAVFGNLVPVDNVPKVAHVLGSAVLVFEVIGMLPHVKSENGEHDLVQSTLHQGIVLHVIIFRVRKPESND